MKKIYFTILITLIITCSAVSDKKAFTLFDKTGNTVKYSDLLEAAQSADIILFGELHDNPICHWLQLELTKDLFKIKGNDLIMGAEMFETDNQLLLDEYTSEKIKESSFEAEAKLWKNYKTDYKPLVNFARKNKLKFIGTNVPRRYASLVSKGGFEILESLDKEAKKLIAPLPIKYNSELNCYASMTKMGGSSMKDTTHINLNLPKAQALKDATMAYSIIENLKNNQLFIHFNGTYHSDNFESMVWYLKEMKSKLKILTISSIEQENISTLEQENLNKADFILCIPNNMTKTY
jgi:uncharacterized iron-regulated protein